MRLGFHMERRYAPYSKWFGSAFAQRLRSAAQPRLDVVLAARGWRDRQQHLVHAYEIVAVMHNELGITEPLSTQASQFHSRPFLIIEAGRFADALRDQIQDERVRNLPSRRSIDQFVGSDRRSIEYYGPSSGEADLRKRLRRQDGKTARRQDGKTSRQDGKEERSREASSRESREEPRSLPPT